MEFASSGSSILQCVARTRLRASRLTRRRVLWPVHGGRGLATVEEAGFRIWSVEVRRSIAFLDAC